MTRDKGKRWASAVLAAFAVGIFAQACVAERAPKKGPADDAAVRKPVAVLTEVDALVASRLPALKSAEDMTRYLDELAAQARRNGHVTALEVEPGMTALQARQPMLGAAQTMKLMLGFAARMNALSQELRSARPAPAR
jgi:hypothetical protein